MISTANGKGKLVNPQKIFEGQVARGMTHSLLADSVYISESHLEDFINGFKEIPKEILMRISQVLDLPIRFFYQWPRCANCNCVVEQKASAIDGFNSLDVHYEGGG